MADATRPFNSAITWAICVLAALVEGFDLQAAGVTAPRFGPEYKLDAAQMGLVFSSNTFGLFIGAAIGGFLSDRVGRKTVLVISMILFGVFSIGTAYAPDAQILILMRFLTGLGLGGALPNVISLTAEAAGGKNSAMVVTMLSAALSFGGAVASAIMLFGGDAIDWRVIFHVGGWAPLILAPLIMFVLPESRAFIAAKAARDARDVNDRSEKRDLLSALFGGGRAISTLALWGSFFFTLVVLYLLLNWLPVLLIGKGLSRPEATMGALWFGIGGAVGALVLVFLMSMGKRLLIILMTYVAMAGALFVLGSVEGNLTTTFAACFVVGAVVIGAQFLLYGISPGVYPVVVRGTGVGFGVAIGRLGAVAGPALAGAILASGAPPTQVLMNILPAVAIAGCAALVLCWPRKSAA